MTPPAAGRKSVRRGPRTAARPPAAKPAVPDFPARLQEWQRAIRRRLTARTALADVVTSTNASLDPQRVGEFLVSWAPTWWPLPAWAIVIADGDGQLTVLAGRGLSDGLVTTVQAVAGWVMHSGEVFACGDMRHDHRLPGPSAAAGALGFPLRGRTGPIGAMVGLDRKPSATDPVLSGRVIAAWNGLLAPAGLALENALLIERARALSVTDDLTRLYNSRYLNQVAPPRDQAGGADRQSVVAALHRSRRVQDGQRHATGTWPAAGRWSRPRRSSAVRARETDVVARFGGDEFAVILPETARDGAVMVAERVRERIAAHGFLAADLLDVRLTASVGVATLPEVAASSEELVQAADRPCTG